MTAIQTSVAPSSVRVTIDRFDEGTRCHTDDVLAIEEPLEIRLVWQVDGKRQQRSLSITMRTPGCDQELAAGFLFGEGIVQHSSQVVRIAHCGPAVGEMGLRNVIKVELAERIDLDWSRFERNFHVTSSCGICGKTSLEAVNRLGCTPPPMEFQIDPEILYALPKRLRSEQAIFDSTGGLHAAALFDQAGNLLAVREDVGRHNALDKLIGAEFLADRLPPTEPRILLLSGRASFELLQKATAAGIGIVAAIGAPSSLAVDLARQSQITLVGFLRNGRCNVYCGPDRIR
ncbi:formate dehydrogenase accessory sulfurtransferase FdhD [Schlesneria paludicola]|uniref:formate dehydrogenase accessory sulfurtransferase FdhD n=1 Tax=Schlesneria paludicola TaxID=360056 RepID=UPI00029B00E5|nr:formate dehydrogenase accessory sulfurtransferase FdhD [Schlesneria paludicola]